MGIPVRNYYRWLREEAWSKERAAVIRPVQAYEALEAEKEAVRGYACRHTELRHRELAWRMIDEDVAYLSPSTVYRILRKATWFVLGEEGASVVAKRSRRHRLERAVGYRPDVLRIGCGQYYLVTFLDEYSRYLVHWELLTDMGGTRVSLAAEKALSRERNFWEGSSVSPPEIRSDNGSCYLSRVQAGASRAGPRASIDPAALSGRKRTCRAEQSNLARSG